MLRHTTIIGSRTIGSTLLSPVDRSRPLGTYLELTGTKGQEQLHQLPSRVDNIQHNGLVHFLPYFRHGPLHACSHLKVLCGEEDASGQGIGFFFPSATLWISAAYTCVLGFHAVVYLVFWVSYVADRKIL